MNSATDAPATTKAIRRQTGTATPSDLIRYAIESKADVEQLERLYALQQKWDADRARRDFVEAMAAAKADAPEIIKEKHVSYQTKTGVTSYMHATLGNVVGVVVPWLARHGFSHRWNTRQDGGVIYVTCVLTHEGGHSEACELFAAPDDSGGKNAIQAVVSTKTYLERHTLLAATGLATADEDDDGRAGGGSGIDLEEANVRNQWRAHMEKIEDMDTLRAAKADMVDAYKGESNVPEELLGVYLKRAKALKAAAPVGGAA
jgi:hypothetical protein